ncbi:hypothetical protein IV80_GL001721 [Pediococcus cellicola]|uniref:Uncharacterized protein n=1 Tax=Pediococcus cellicola TaxID=319652 RepID=A0A0R2IV96_9LACO|nr:hypothetical protein IV80_GL001721 [Pediococcus cellicola]GEL15693.1 hypothetical protein PCE01_14950 [Pediococcus cellicola]
MILKPQDYFDKKDLDQLKQYKFLHLKEKFVPLCLKSNFIQFQVEIALQRHFVVPISNNFESAYRKRLQKK